MKDGPDIARIASLIGEPARANILSALLSGKALTATELSKEAGVSLQTTSSHLKQLTDGGLLKPRKQGRHRYFMLAHEDVAHLLESLMGLANGMGHIRTRTGPRDEDLRKARVCYNHLAGHMGVQMYNSLMGREFLKLSKNGMALTEEGVSFTTNFGIDIDELKRKRSPLCRECLDWSERQSHLAGSVGRALFQKMEERNWFKRNPGSRAVLFTPAGERDFNTAFPKIVSV